LPIEKNIVSPEASSTPLLSAETKASPDGRIARPFYLVEHITPVEVRSGRRSRTSSLLTIGSSLPKGAGRSRQGAPIELLGHRTEIMLVVALDDIDVIAMSDDFRQGPTQPVVGSALG